MHRTGWIDQSKGYLKYCAAKSKLRKFSELTASSFNRKPSRIPVAMRCRMYLLIISGAKLVQDALGKLLMSHVQPRQQYCFVELGAGKGTNCNCQSHNTGGLSVFIAEKYPEARKNFNYILIDRKNSRRKGDVYLKNMNIIFERHFIDIKDLELNLLIPRDCDRVVFTGKHLCGAATCLSLTAIQKLAQIRPSL